MRSGSGRAVLAINEGASNEQRQAIWDACLTDQRLDRQTEDIRGQYLLALAAKAGLRDRLRNGVLDPAQPFEDSQRLSFWELFAKDGDHACIAELQDKALDGDFSASDALAEIGELSWVISNILPTLSPDEAWRAKMWLSESPEVSTEEQEALERTAATHQPTYKLNREEQTFEEVIQKLQNSNLYNASLSRMAPSLTEEQVLLVANLWLEEREHRKGLNYAKLFDAREFPLPPATIIKLVRDGDAPVQFQNVLSWIDSPEVREFALELINSGDYRGFLSGACSWTDGDIQGLSHHLTKFGALTRGELHRLCMELLTMCKEWNPDERIDMLTWVYEQSPCSMCRGGATRRLVDDQTLPAVYWQELEFDAESGNRDLFAKRFEPKSP